MQNRQNTFWRFVFLGREGHFLAQEPQRFPLFPPPTQQLDQEAFPNWNNDAIDAGP